MIGPLKKKPIRLKANSKRISGNSVISGSPLGAQNKDFGDASQTLLNGVKLRLRRRLGNPRQSVDSGFDAMNSGFQVLNFSVCEGNFDSGFQWDSRFLERYSGFQSPGFQISQAKFFQGSDSTSKNLPDFWLPYMERLGSVIRRLNYRAYLSEFAQTFFWFLVLRINHF